MSRARETRERKKRKELQPVMSPLPTPMLVECLGCTGALLTSEVAEFLIHGSEALVNSNQLTHTHRQ